MPLSAKQEPYHWSIKVLAIISWFLVN